MRIRFLDEVACVCSTTGLSFISIFFADKEFESEWRRCDMTTWDGRVGVEFLEERAEQDEGVKGKVWKNEVKNEVWKI